MKLLSKAQAVLTLGPMMPRDKFMQTADRLRQLNKGQSLTIVGKDKVCRMVPDCCMVPVPGIQPVHVLEWVHHNTATLNSEVCSRPCQQ
jgi:3-deoxy-D-arabino-heptulosonate 7-phosphate (DAHP) synthase class II